MKSGGATVRSATGPPQAKPGKPELDESEGPDTGFSTALPYKQSGSRGARRTARSGGCWSACRRPSATRTPASSSCRSPPDSLLFVFAMHALYASRRAAAEAALAEAALETE